jgi:hypothetical protein
MYKKIAQPDVLILMATWYFLVPSAAQAYFDLGTGQYLINLLFAFAVTAWFSIKRVIIPRPKAVKSLEAEASTNKPPVESEGETSV